MSDSPMTPTAVPPQAALVPSAPVPLVVDGMTIVTHNHPCCNACRFCSAGRKHFDNVRFDDFAQVMERFLDWNDRVGRVSRISPFILYTHAHMPYEQAVRYRELCERGHYRPLPLQMNGCLLMPEDDMERLLAEQRRAGYDSLTLTFCGTRELHDRWVSRKGEFDQLLRIARIAARLGYTREEQLFLTRSSIPVLDELLETLDAIPGARTRRIYPVNRIGRACQLDGERMTRALLAGISPRALPYVSMKDVLHNGEDFKTQVEWAAWTERAEQTGRTCAGGSDVRKRSLRIHVTEEALPRLLSGDCGEIFDGHLTRAERVYRAIPSVAALALEYADPNDDRLYALYELERAWCGRYLEQYHPELEDDYRLASL